MESQPQNPELRNNPENFHPCRDDKNRSCVPIDVMYMWYLIYNISSVGSQNLVTLIFTKATFCQRGNTKRIAHS